jgi:hypothetical protein
VILKHLRLVLLHQVKVILVDVVDMLVAAAVEQEQQLLM